VRWKHVVNLSSPPPEHGAGAGRLQELISKQAEWSEEVNNYDAAAEMYIKVCTYHLALPEACIVLLMPKCTV
jgi:hypothetical protein